MPVKPCLLVVDDEVDMVESVRDLLRREYHVLTATRASEGLEIIANQHVHVVMTDQRMPEMTGVEFLKFLRERFPDTVRLLFTAYADVAAITDAINQGNVYRYIPKPWQPDELRAVLKQAVDHYQLQADRKRLLLEVQEKNRQLETANLVLRRADELKRAFIRVASHELRTPLTLLVGLSELALQSDQPQAPLSDWLGQLHNAANRLTLRVDEMVKLYQAERFDLPFMPRDVSLPDLVQDAVREVQHFVSKRRQTLRVDAPDALGTICVEPDKIHDALVQLLINAIKFTPDEGTIGIEAARLEDGGVSITVSDTGRGMDADCIKSIFDPFFTGFDVSRHCSGTFEHDRRGLGLGLAVVRAFAERHKGRIEVQSQPGQGSRFTLLLPPAV